MQTKFVKPKNLDLKVIEEDDGTGYVEGYASVFGNVDSMGEVVEQGAFKRTIDNNLSAGKIKFVDFHNSFRSSEEILGVVEEAEEDEHGLKFSARLSSTQRAQDVRTKIKEGILDALSIGYDVVRDTIEDNIRYLNELKLFEVSIVSWGANSLAGVTNVKGDEQLQLNRIINFAQSKEGRVLSEDSLKLVEEAITALETLLDNADPEKSTQHQDPPDKSNDDPGDHSSEEWEQIKDVLSPLREYRKKKEAEEVRDRLRQFGKQLREVK